MTRRKVEMPMAARPRAPTETGLSSGDHGRPVEKILARLEQRNPGLAAESGLSSSAMRAGDLVRRLRKAAQLSQATLAQRIGVSQARISEIEAGSGPQGPTWDVMERIFAACNASVIVVPRSIAGLPYNLGEAVTLFEPVVFADGRSDVIEAIRNIAAEETTSG